MLNEASNIIHFLLFISSNIFQEEIETRTHNRKAPVNIEKKEEEKKRESFSSIYFLSLAIQIGGSLNTHIGNQPQMSLCACRLAFFFAGNAERKKEMCKVLLRAVAVASKGAALLCIPFVW